MGNESLVILLLLLIVVLLAVLLRQGFQRDAAIAALCDQLQPCFRSEANELFARLETDRSLRDRLGLHLGLPYSHNWSAAPDFLKLIVEHALIARPETIVECSSGLTTVMLARCCEMNGQGRLFSLENGPDYAARTRSALDRYGLTGKATVIDAPLVPHNLNGWAFEWYALDELPDLSIDMLVIDGPPGFIQRHSRYPALPLLRDKLADGCVVFMDDAARPDEQEIIGLWQDEFPGIEHEYINTERGCAIFRLHRASA
jgi:predicted O-methyltransferase YrrM